MVFLAGWLLGCTCRDSSRGADASRARKVDVHVHAPPEAIGTLLRLMDAHGIDRAVNLSGGWPGMGLERSLAAAKSTNGRVVVFATPPLQLLSEGVTPAELAAHLTQVRTLGARGIKIFKALGLSYQWPDGSLVAVDDARLDVFFEEAGRLGLPISIHTGDPKAFWLPVTPANERVDELTVHPSWSNAGKPLPSWETLYSAFLRRVARHPKTTFIGVHFGNDPEDLGAVSAALDANPNLYVDTAARVPELGRQPDQLRALVARHPTRVLFGTDLGVGAMPGELMLGSSGATPPTSQEVEHFFRATWRFFETRDENFEHPTPIQGRWRISGAGLNGAQLERLYSKNAEALLFR